MVVRRFRIKNIYYIYIVFLDNMKIIKIVYNSLLFMKNYNY